VAEALTDEQVKEMLDRFNGPPGKAPGLGKSEMMVLFQHLIDSGKVYDMTCMTPYHVQAWSDAGHIKGFDVTKMKQPLDN
jgi:hypothetical protein